MRRETHTTGSEKKIIAKKRILGHHRHVLGAKQVFEQLFYLSNKAYTLCLN